MHGRSEDQRILQCKAQERYEALRQAVGPELHRLFGLVTSVTLTANYGVKQNHLRSPRAAVPQHTERSAAEVLRCARVRETEEKNRKEEEDDKWSPLLIERREFKQF